METRLAAEPAHRLAQRGLDEGVHDDGGPALHPVDGQLQVRDVLDARVTDLLELLVGKLRLERLDDALGGLARRVGDHVELDRCHRRSVVES